MISVETAIAVAGGFAVVSAVMLIWMRLRAYQVRPDPELSETSGFSLARYQPMAHLLADEDFLFLAEQAGYHPEIGVKFRRERRRVFRLYLRELARDFRRLHAEAREMVAQSGEQHAELVGVLMRQQVTFWRAVAAVEMRLVVESLGLGKVDVRVLVEAVERMRLDLARFAAPAAETP